jgi:DNA-binding FrmR family transcriptional regulator
MQDLSGGTLVSDQREFIETGPGQSVTTPDGAPVTSPGCAADPRPMMDPQGQAEVLLRLAKAAGQVQGVARMVGDGRYCVDVLTQISAAQKALDGAARVITRNYLERCVTDAIANGDPLIYDEVMKVIDRRR